MLPSQKLQAVLFDVDGTMFDTETLSTNGWLHAGKVTGYERTPEQFQELTGKSLEEDIRLFQDWFGEDVPYWDIRKVRTAYMEDFIEANGVPLKEGLLPLLELLSKQQIPLGIGTGTARADAEPRLLKSGILSHFSAVVYGDDVAHGKPAPDVYLKAAELLSVDIRHCLVLEDSIPGIQAALASGAHVIAIPDQIPLSEELTTQVDSVFSSLTAVAELFR